MNLENAQHTIREVAQGIVREESAEVDREARWPLRSLRGLQDAGVGGLTAPKQWGGLGGGLMSLVQASEALGYECGSAAMCYGMHCVATAVIASKATSEQVEKFLIPIAEGRHLTTLSLSEPGSGSHFYIPEMKMQRSGEFFELDGKKSFVTNGSFADSYVVSTVEGRESAAVGEFSMLIVPKETPGVVWEKPWDGFGMRGNASAAAVFERVRVPLGNLLGQTGDQIWYVFEVVAPFFLAAMAGTYLGIANAALDEAIAHVKARGFSHSGTQLSGVAVLQHRIGLLWSRVESARQIAYHAAKLGDAQDPSALAAILSAKAEVGDCATLVTNEVMTLMGGRGYAESGKVARLLRDARGAHVMSPTTDLLRTWTGRALLGLPLLSEG